MLYDFSKINMNELLEDAYKLNWDYINVLCNCDDKLSILYNNLRILLNKHVKKKRTLIRDSPYDWMTAEILLQIKKREKAYKIWLKTRSVEDKAIYRTIVNRINKLKIQAKKQFFRTQLDPSLDKKKLYKNVRSIGLIDNNVTSVNFDAESLNTYFTDQNKGKAAIVCADKHCDYNPLCGFSFHPVDELEVVTKFNEVSSNAMGIDEIPTMFLRLVMPIIIPWLTNIINYSIISSTFPGLWKTAIIIPVPKIDSPCQLNDFRPISLLCMLSKVYEKILSNQIQYYLLQNRHFFDQLQSGYKKFHSTTTALLKVNSDIAENINNSKRTLLILLDFSKAFDKVSHLCLISKLKLHFKFSGPALNLMLSYLSCRKNVTKVREIYSSEREMVKGVPQGSILGPLLFSLFITDLPFCLNSCYHHCYADDTQLYMEIDESNMTITESKISKDLASVLCWSSTNDLQLNIGETSYCF